MVQRPGLRHASATCVGGKSLGIWIALSVFFFPLIDPGNGQNVTGGAGRKERDHDDPWTAETSARPCLTSQDYDPVGTSSAVTPVQRMMG